MTRRSPRERIAPVLLVAGGALLAAGALVTAQSLASGGGRLWIGLVALAAGAFDVLFVVRTRRDRR